MPILTLPDAAIFHACAGSGNPPIMLVHGGMCDHRDWERLVPLLAGTHRIVTPDLRGHGRSNGSIAGCTIGGWADDLLALIAALGLERPVLLGHSLASRVVTEAAARQSGNIGGVVLLDGSRSHGGHAAAPSDAPAPATSLDAVIAATIGPYADAAARSAVAERMAAASPEVMAACVTAMRTWDTQRADAAFAALAGRLPLLAIQSTYHDAATPRRALAGAHESTPYLDFLRESVPQLEIAVIPQAGHFLMLEHPETVAALIHDFALRSHGG